MRKIYQNMNQYGTTTCGIIIDYDKQEFAFYPCQHTDVCYGKKTTKKRVYELLNECRASGFKERSISYAGKEFYGSGKESEE